MDRDAPTDKDERVPDQTSRMDRDERVNREKRIDRDERDERMDRDERTERDEPKDQEGRMDRDERVEKVERSPRRPSPIPEEVVREPKHEVKPILGEEGEITQDGESMDAGGAAAPAGDLEDISDDDLDLDEFGADAGLSNMESNDAAGGLTMDQVAEEIDWLGAGNAKLLAWLPDSDGQVDLRPLEAMRNPALTDYEWQGEVMKRNLRSKSRRRGEENEEEEEEPRPAEAVAILEMIGRHPATTNEDEEEKLGEETLADPSKGRRDDKWVTTLEELPTLLPVGLSHLIAMEGRYDVLTTLIHWTFEGLDLEKAMCQPETPFKVRHLKAGIALATALCNCDNHIASEANKPHLQHKLLSLFMSPSMSTSVKLHIVKAIEASIRLNSGMQHFFTLASDEEGGATPYNRLVDLVASTKQLARVMVALSVIFRKAHVYEELSLLMKATEEAIAKVAAHEKDREEDEEEDEKGFVLRLEEGSSKELDVIVGFLNEVVETWRKGEEIFTAHRRCLPATKQFSTLVAESDWTSFLCHMLDTHSVLESVAMLLTSDLALAYAPLQTTIFKLLKALTQKPEGLVYLGNRIGVVKRILCYLIREENFDPSEGTIPVLSSGNGDETSSERDASVPPMDVDEASKDEDGAEISNTGGKTSTSTKSSALSRLSFVPTTTAGKVGFHVLHRLTVLQLLDGIKVAKETAELSKTSDEEPKSEASLLDEVAVLSSLHCLLEFATSVSSDAVVSVLTSGTYMDILIPFLDILKNPQDPLDARDAESSKTMVSAAGYTIQLIAIAAKNCDDVNFMRKYAKTVIGIVGKTDADLSLDVPNVDMLRELWGVTADVSGFDVTTIGEWSRLFKTLSEDSTESTINKSLITSLRVLVDLCIPPEEKNDGEPDQGEFADKETPMGASKKLEYRFALVEFFHEEGKLCLQNVLIKTCADYLTRPWQQGALLNSTDVSAAIIIVQHSVALLTNILKHLVQARSTEFKDVTPVQPLFGVFNVLCGIQTEDWQLPQKRIAHIRHNVIEGFMSMTQLSDITAAEADGSIAIVSSESATDDDAVNLSLWTMMIKEILEVCQSMPYYFYGGMLLLSELLPFPLPIMSRQTMTAAELAVHAEHRKRWSMHIVPLKNLLVDTIKTQALCMPHAHQGAFQKLCSQIADLSHHTAAIVLGSFQDMALDCLHLIIGNSVKPTSASFETTPGGLDPAAACAKIMCAFSVLVSQPSIKCTFLSLLDVNSADIESLKATSDSKGRYGAVADPSRAPRFLAILMHVFEESTDNTLTLQLQESIAQVFQYLLDSDINLCGPYTPLNVLLANTIPSPKYLRDIAEALISHIGNSDHSLNSVITALKALSLFSEFDYTMFHLKSAFNQAMKNFENDGTSDLYNLFARLTTSFSKDLDYLQLLHCSIDFINVMITVERREDEPNSDSGGESPYRNKEHRRYVFSPEQMKKLLKWEGDRESKHPVGDLEKLLHDYALEEEEEGEETLQGLHETLVNILGLIFGDGAPAPGRKTTTNMVEIDMKEKPRTLEAKFTTRYMYDVTTEEDERMKYDFWEEEVANIYNPADDDLVKVDLMLMAEKYANAFDLQEALDKSNPDLPDDFKVSGKSDQY